MCLGLDATKFGIFMMTAYLSICHSLAFGSSARLPFMCISVQCIMRHYIIFLLIFSLLITLRIPVKKENDLLGLREREML